MRRRVAILVLGQAALVAGFLVALRSGRFPLGVRGEWEWPRIEAGPAALPAAAALLAVAGFASFVALGSRSLRHRDGAGRELAWVSGLFAAAALTQALVQEGAPEGYGLAKWVLALQNPGSSGYYTVARAEMGDARRFLADYPAWIARQDALHVGTHPPGLFLVARGILGLMDASPGAARAVVAHAPGSASTAARAMREATGLPRADAAALIATGFLTLLGCSATVAPLYLLARATLPAPAAWAAAALWPLAPSAILFQPTADTAFPLLSSLAMALAAWARRTRGAAGIATAIASGLALAVGMAFTLAFLAVGLVVALILIAPPGPGLGRRAALVVATGQGFLAATLAGWAAISADPFAIWWANQRNHARFYVEYPRSYAAWLAANPVELSVGLGLPATLSALALALACPRQFPRITWATLAVLATLTLSGRSLSEVGRLWLPLMPPLLVAAGAGLDRIGAGPRAVAGIVAITGVLTLGLEATIQVVYPI